MTEKRFDDLTGEEMARRLGEIRRRIAAAARESGRQPEEISLMAVTKTVPQEFVNLAVDQGVTLLGENRAQELCAKFADYKRERCSVHFIGALQTNKVRQIVDKVDMVQSVASLHLAQEISRQCQKLGKTMPILLEVNIGGEESKSGVLPQELPRLVEEVCALPALSLQGLMAIPPICQEKAVLASYFYRMREIFIDIGRQNRDNMNMRVLSMGMSGDYEEAVRQGATLVRIGTGLFGARNYGEK